MKKEATPNPQLRTARLEKCWTMAKAAEKVNVSYGAYSRWEYGWQDPHLDSLLMLCNAFAMSPEELGFGYIIKKPLQKTKDEIHIETAQPTELIQLTREQVLILSSLFQGDNAMTFDETKRKAIQDILATAGIAMTTPLILVDPEPWERLATGKSSDVDTRTLAHFEDLTRTCWQLSNGSELNVAEKLLPQFLPRLQELAPHYPQASMLASQGLQLKSILVAHRMKLSDKISLCQQAVEHARVAHDFNLLAAALVQSAVAYNYAGQTENAMRAYQEALQYSHQVSAVLRSRIYIEAAATFAQYARRREAEFYLDLAYETYPDHPENDPSYLFADCPYAVLPLYEGQTMLELGRPGDAWNSFQKSMTGAVAPERIRLEVVNHAGRAAITLGDLDKYATSLEDGLSGAITLKSRKRYNEAVSFFKNIPTSWSKEPRIKAIAEQYQLSTN